MNAWVVTLVVAAGAAGVQTAQDFAPVKSIDAATMSGIDGPRQAVVRSQREWEALWRQHAPAGRPVPAVDFAKRMVVGVFIGSRPTGGFSVTITRARLDGATLIVEWSERAPSPRDISAQVVTSPAHIVELPRHDGAIRFDRVEIRP